MGKIWMPGGGGGADTDVVTAGAGDVLAGKVIVGPDGEPLDGTLALSGNATAAQVLSGKTFYNTDAKTILTGTMASKGAQTKTFTPSTSKQTYTIPAGYHNGSGVVTCNAIPSTYIPISSANFFKNGTLGSLYTLGVGPKVPGGLWAASGTNSLVNHKVVTFTWDGTWYRNSGTQAEHFPLKSVALSSSDITNGVLRMLMLYQGSYPAGSSEATYTTSYATRKTIDFTSLNTLRTNINPVSGANVYIMFWVLNPTTKSAMYYRRNIVQKSGLIDISVSSMSGHCLFGFWAADGTQSNTAKVDVTEISLLQ